MKRPILAFTLIAVVPGQEASAETINYSYDALGRLVFSNVSGGPTSGATTGIAYDAAGNRTSYSVSGWTAANATTVRAAGERTELASESFVQTKAVASPA